MRHLFSKKDLIKLTGVGGETIRYYEKIGVLDTPKRNVNGYRMFSDHHVSQLKFVKMCRNLGFSIDTIRQLQARQASDTPQHIDEFVHQQLREIDDKIAKLLAIKETLMGISECSDHTQSCKAVDFLQGNGAGE